MAIWLQENGSTGVDRFDIEIKMQVWSHSWGGFGPGQWINVDDPHFTWNSSWPDSATTWTPPFTFRATWAQAR